jgi:hypothetical protein
MEHRYRLYGESLPTVWKGVGRGSRQSQRERAPATEGAEGRDVAAHPARKVATDREAKPDALTFSGWGQPETAPSGVAPQSVERMMVAVSLSPANTSEMSESPVFGMQRTPATLWERSSTQPRIGPLLHLCGLASAPRGNQRRGRAVRILHFRCHCIIIQEAQTDVTRDEVGRGHLDNTEAVAWSATGLAS